ncbi:MAG: hypothetical protein ABH832_04335 [bacterium]
MNFKKNHIFSYKKMIGYNKLVIINDQGVAALLTVVIVGAAALMMAFAASMLGIGESQMAFDSAKKSEIFAFADGCIEEGLNQLRQDSAYTGSSLNLNGGMCIITASGVANNRFLTASATKDNYYSRIEADVDLTSNQVSITRWENK